MADNNQWPPLPTLLGFAAILAVGGVALYFLLPVFGTTAGLFVAVSSTGLSTAGVVATWVAPVATAGTAVLATTAAVAGIKKVSDSARAKPFEWGLPLLAAIGGVAATVAQDVGLRSIVAKWLFGGITALLIVVAGACYSKQGAGWKSVGILFYLLPPLSIITWSAVATDQPSIAESFAAVGVWTWMGLGFLTIIGIMVGVLAHFDQRV